MWEYSGGGTQSNTMSLRELNNPVITVFFELSANVAQDTFYDVVCAEEAVKIVTTVSSSGRCQTSLSN